MAIVTAYVDPDAGGSNNGTSWTNAYTSLSTCMSTESGGSPNVVTSSDLVTNTEELVVECRSSSGTADTSLVSVDGFTTDATYGITINGDNTSGAWNTSAYRIEYTLTGTSQEILTVRELNVTINDMQVQLTCDNATYTGTAYWSVSVGEDHTYNRCIARGVISNNPNTCHGFNFSTDPIVANNCLAYGFDGTGSCVGFYTDNNIENGVTLNNCTAYGCNIGYDPNSQGDNLLQNVLVQNCTTDWGGTAFVATNCCSEDGTVSATTNTGEITGTVTFVDAGGGDFTPTSGDTVAKDAGTDLSGTFTDDLAGFTRDGSFDVGALENQGGGSNLTFQPNSGTGGMASMSGGING